MRRLSTICLVAWILLIASVASAASPFQFETALHSFRASDSRFGSPPGIADFNGDGSNDIVCTWMSDTVFYLLFNEGNGQLKQPVMYTTHGEFLYTLVTGDINGDGYSDIVIRTTDSTFWTPTHEWTGISYLRTYINQGDGSFLPGTQTVLDSTYDLESDMFGGDLDGDGDLDLVIGGFQNHEVGIYLNDASGHFSLQQRYATEGGGKNLTLADFDRNGSLDLAVVGNSSANVHCISVMAGRGDGTFNPPAVIPLDPAPRSVTSGDFNGDGVLDILVGHSASPPFLTVLLGNGEGAFPSEVKSPAPYRVNAIGLCALDLNYDSWADAVSTNFSMPSMVFSVNETNGSFSTPTDVKGVASNAGPLIATDLDSDGDLDIVCSRPDGIGILIHKMAAGDLDESGNQDIADLTFMVNYLYLGGATPKLAAADVDGDGRADISDLIALTSYLYLNGAAPVCR